MIWMPLDVRDALAGPPPVIDYVLPNLPVGATGILCGPGGVGKTTAGTQLAVELVLGIPLLGGLFPAHPSGDVLLVLAEEPAEIMAKRLRDVASTSMTAQALQGRRKDDIHALLAARLKVYPLAGQEVAILLRGVASRRLGELQKLAKGCRLVIVDPLRRFHDGNENDSGAMTDVVQAFERIAREAGAALIVIHHANKASAMSPPGDWQQSSRGSSALSDAVRWQANLASMTPDEAKQHRVADDDRFRYVRFSLVKSNYGPLPPSVWLRRLEGGVLVPTPLISSTKRGRPAAQRELVHD